MRPDGQVEQSTKFDKWKWLLIAVLLVSGIVVDYVYRSVAWPIRLAGGIVLVALLLLLASQTQKGRRAWGFIKGSRQELRKVTWPSRQETVQTTLVVVGMVILTALILWGVDTLFMWAIGWLAGQRG